MSRYIEAHELELRDEVALAPNIRQDVDRTFGLPVFLHSAYFGLFLAYLAIMGLGFQSPDMILPMAIFVIFTMGFYVVPLTWAVMNPAKQASAMPMAELLGRGIETLTGRTKGGDAVAQVLILPILILGWGIAVVSIAALV
ncbi:hypothetical protein [Sphingomicrobium flavum]|uniref:hypothetical protein n=1 Tax=Sphingomicrobium flavum TaxID=1229164 RepID=UPI0021AD9807|nr:hypothetical protein [Sphingomicrobium flavum]